MWAPVCYSVGVKCEINILVLVIPEYDFVMTNALEVGNCCITISVVLFTCKNPYIIVG